MLSESSDRDSHMPFFVPETDCGGWGDRGGWCLRAKKSSLDEVNFEEFVVLKGNMDLLEKMGQEDIEEEEDDL